MQVYCPRCATTYSDLEPEAFADGVCDTCDGQLITGEFQASVALPGAIAMTFETGSRVAIPFSPQYDEAYLSEAEQLGEAPVEEDTPTAVHGGNGGVPPAMMADDPTVRDDSLAAFAAQAAGLGAAAADSPLSESDLFGVDDPGHVGDHVSVDGDEQWGGQTEEMQLGDPAVEFGGQAESAAESASDPAAELPDVGLDIPIDEDGVGETAVDGAGLSAADSGWAGEPTVEQPPAAGWDDVPIDEGDQPDADAAGVDVPIDEEAPTEEVAMSQDVPIDEPTGDEGFTGEATQVSDSDGGELDAAAQTEGEVQDEAAAQAEAPPAEQQGATDSASDEVAASDEAPDEAAAQDPSALDDAAADDAAADEAAADEAAQPEMAADQVDVDAGGADDQPQPGEAGTPSEDAPPAADGEVPAHLALPAIDFSMPEIPGVADGAPAPEDAAPPADDGAEADGQAEAAPGEDVEQPATEDDSESPGALPAHLQLPSFPAFDINFDPDAATEQAAEAQAELEQEREMAEQAELPNQQEGEPSAPAAHLQPGAVPPGPPPPPPPIKKKKKAEPAGAPLPGLPDLGVLPDIEPQNVVREPTLLGSDALAKVAELDQKSSVVPIVLGILLLLVALGGVGFWQKDAIVGALSPDTGEGPTETSEDKAKRMLAEGLQEVEKAKEAEKEDKKGKAAKSYKKAIAKFNEAIELHPKFARAHRELAVVYATVKKEKKAVDHYGEYLNLAPDADDAADVKKIIADWEKAQKEKEKEKEKQKPKGRKR